MNFAQNFALKVLVASALVAPCFGTAIAANKSSGKALVIEGDPKPFGNPNAPQGGTVTFNLDAEPSTLHPITASDLYARNVQNWVCEGLLDKNPNTDEWVPGLAERAEVSADGKQYTFRVRKGALWQDGQPITAEDVKFSFDMIFEPKYEAAHMRPYYESIEKAEIVDPQTVRFTAKEKYFGNLSTLAGLTVLPRHIYGDVDKSKKMNKTLLCSGPYKLEKFDQGQSITLVRNKQWWGNQVSSKKGEYNFERIRFRFIGSEDIVIEMLKKGELDFADLRAEAFMKKAVGPEWDKTIFKKKVENHIPKPYSYLGFNARKPMFQDVKVRHALSLLFNRQEIITKFLYNLSKPGTGPWYQQSEYADPAQKPTPFDPKKAVELLKEAGWTDADKTGILSKTLDGKKVEFRFTLFFGNPDTEKYWIMYQSDLKKFGIDLRLQKLEWNALLKAIDGGEFDSIAMGWAGGAVDLDPKQIWHSTSAVKGGSNHLFYKNADVDKLIDEGRVELDKKKRIGVFRKVYAQIAKDMPEIFLFDRAYDLYAVSARLKMSKPTFEYSLGQTYWWIEANK
jgi:microcin C transport system substrate-binding protein